MKIRRAAGLGAAVVAMLGFAAAASAQRGFGGPGFDGAEARSNPLGLLMRIDVKSHLHVTLKQQQAIEEVLTGAQKRQQEQRQALFQNRPQPNNAQGLSRDERRQQMQQFFQQNAEQMRAGRQQFEGELSEQIKQILKPEQVSRLYQLDYQHRGPLALADPKVAQDVKLSPETQQEVQKIVADYRTQSGELRREFFEGFRGQAGQQGQPGQRRPQGFNLQDMERRMAPLQQKLDKLKKETEDKILAILNAQEKTNWQALQGAPFAFRKDIQTGNPLSPARGFSRGQGGPGGQRPGGGFRGGARPF